jgi:hypothetical protein
MAGIRRDGNIEPIPVAVAVPCVELEGCDGVCLDGCGAAFVPARTPEVRVLKTGSAMMIAGNIIRSCPTTATCGGEWIASAAVSARSLGGGGGGGSRVG